MSSLFNVCQRVFFAIHPILVVTARDSNRNHGRRVAHHVEVRKRRQIVLRAGSGSAGGYMFQCETAMLVGDKLFDDVIISLRIESSATRWVWHVLAPVHILTMATGRGVMLLVKSAYLQAVS
jgi:hypothetical protein